MTFGSARTRIAVMALLAAVAMLGLSAGASAQRSPGERSTRRRPGLCSPTGGRGNLRRRGSGVARSAGARSPSPKRPARSQPSARAGHENCQQELPINGCLGLRPQDLHSAYGLPTSAPTPQTIALVDAYDDPTAEKDLKHYDEEFGLPACTTANHCFRKINAEGAKKPLPAANGGWALEISLDIEVAHAICQTNCRILLVEAQSACYPDLEAAENRAVTEGATEISNSWYGREPLTDSAAYDHPGTVITAAAGDEGFLNWAGKEGTGCSEPGVGLVNYPASSPHVIAVGGTRLTLNSPSETLGVRDGLEPVQRSRRQRMQHRVRGTLRGSSNSPTGRRSDVDPSARWRTSRPTRIPTPGSPSTTAPPTAGARPGGWKPGGTSASSPLIAAAFALAGGSGGVEYPAQDAVRERGPEPLGTARRAVRLQRRMPARRRRTLQPGWKRRRPAQATPSASRAPATTARRAWARRTGSGRSRRSKKPGKTAQTIDFSSTPPQHAAAGAGSYTVAASASSAPSRLLLLRRAVGVHRHRLDGPVRRRRDVHDRRRPGREHRIRPGTAGSAGLQGGQGQPGGEFRNPRANRRARRRPGIRSHGSGVLGPAGDLLHGHAIDLRALRLDGQLPAAGYVHDRSRPGRQRQLQAGGDGGTELHRRQGHPDDRVHLLPARLRGRCRPPLHRDGERQLGPAGDLLQRHARGLHHRRSGGELRRIGHLHDRRRTDGRTPNICPRRRRSMSFAVSGESQTIAFTSSPPAPRAWAARSTPLTATATSALPVLYSSATPAVCTIARSSP